MSEVSTISSASSRMACIRVCSSRMPSVTERSGASGWGRLVSLNRRTSASWLASRKISTGLSRGILRSRPRIFGNEERKFPSRTSTTIATLSMSPPARSDSLARVGMSVVGRLSTQKYPRSSSARIACDFPEPESPVRTMNGWPPSCRRPCQPLPARPAFACPSSQPCLPSCLSRLPARCHSAISSSSSSSRRPGAPPARNDCSSRSASARAAWCPRDLQQLVACRHLDQNRDAAAGAPPASESAARATRAPRNTRRRARAARTRATDPTVRGGRPAPRVWTTGWTRCRTGP